MQSTSMSAIEVPLHAWGLFSSEYPSLGQSTREEKPQTEAGRFTIDVPVRRRLRRGLGLTSVVPNALRGNWVGFQKAKLSVGMRARITQLAFLSDGWRGGGSRSLSADSLKTFLRLWQLIEGAAREPFVTLAPNGNLFLEWHTSWKKHLDIQCLPDDLAIFGLLNGKNEISGRADVQAIVGTIAAVDQRPFRWG